MTPRRGALEYRSTIVKVEPAGTSHLGNPTYRVTFKNGFTRLTETDGSIGYSMENRGDVPLGEVIFVQAHKSGRIWNILTLDRARAAGLIVD